MLQRYLLISLRTASLVDAPDMIQNKTVIFQFQRSKKEKKNVSRNDRQRAQQFHVWKHKVHE